MPCAISKKNLIICAMAHMGPSFPNGSWILANVRLSACSLASSSSCHGCALWREETFRRRGDQIICWLLMDCIVDAWQETLTRHFSFIFMCVRSLTPSSFFWTKTTHAAASSVLVVRTWSYQDNTRGATGCGAHSSVRSTLFRCPFRKGSVVDNV